MSDDKKGSGGKWALGALLAGVVGYVTGILSAPRSGKETRDNLKQSAAGYAVEAERKLDNLRTDLEDAMVSARQQVDKFVDSTKGQITNALAEADRAKTKAKEVLQAFRGGETDDDELRRAVVDAEKALKDLKSFLKK